MNQTDEFSTGLNRLCEWATACRWEDMPEPVRKRAVLVLLDDISVMIAGSLEPEPARYREKVLSRLRCAESVVFAVGLPAADRFQAASLNALAGNWCELDEGFRRTICHAGIYVLPALLAEAQALGLRYTQVLRALVLAYEVVTRIAMSFRFAQPAVHGHALWSSIGAAAGVVIARGGNAAELFGAVTAAATTASMGPRPHLVEGVLVRNGWAAAGAVNGLQCADWAACGIQGAESSIPAVYRDILGAAENFNALDDQLGVEWSIASGYHKIYACCQHGHSAVEAVLELVRSHALDAGRIRSIVVYTHPLALTLSNPEPSTTLGAKFSMPHMVAAPFVFGTGSARAFSSDALHDPQVAHLRRIVELRPYEEALVPPHDRPAKVVIVTADGQVHESECLSAQGGPDRPLPESVLEQKVRELSAPVLPGLASLLASGCIERQGSTPWGELLDMLR